MQRIAVLASGGGSNLQAILEYLDALGDGRPGDVVLVASDRGTAGVLEIGRARGITAEALANPADSAALLALLSKHRADFVALAGYLKLVPAGVAQRFRGRIVNVHPALLPRHGGPGMYGLRVHASVLAARDRESGASVHFVDEAYDRGPLIARARVPVKDGDTPESLAARVLRAEHALYPRVLHAVIAGLVSLSADRKTVSVRDGTPAALPPTPQPIEWARGGRPSHSH